jgi:hypothetical protein
VKELLAVDNSLEEKEINIWIHQFWAIFKKDWAQHFFCCRFLWFQFVLKWGEATSWCSIAKVSGEKIRPLVAMVVDENNTNF